ncbi:MAG TPA: glycerol-3-phosphate 1-O-acyltransferase PlsY [Verrucomicrobiae bacterium]|nr:glycerol-3-phosphate 1-O-acyltransferase PlsY [Verrucomicrobiae bacterium]
MPVSGYILTVLLAYLLGSIPTGFLVGKARGIDIRTLGSGNIGATNVLRYLGTVAGVMVLLADALKGFLAVAGLTRLIWHVFGTTPDPLNREWLEIAAGLGAIVGHNFTCWLRFKGGKGIATSAGVLVALVPYALLIILGVWIIVLALTRYVSLASICASFTLPFAVWITGGSFTMIAITAAMTALAIYKHKSNMQRLFKGTETRLGQKPAAARAEAPKTTA